MKLLALLALGVALSACSGYPIVRNPDDADGQSHGSVSPLSAHFATDATKPLRVIFVHGSERYLSWLCAQLQQRLAKHENT